MYDAGAMATPPPGAGTTLTKAPVKRVGSVRSIESSLGWIFCCKMWKNRSFLRSDGEPLMKSDTLGPPARAIWSKAVAWEGEEEGKKKKKKKSCRG